MSHLFTQQNTIVETIFVFFNEINTRGQMFRFKNWKVIKAHSLSAVSVQLFIKSAQLSHNRSRAQKIGEAAAQTQVPPKAVLVFFGHEIQQLSRHSKLLTIPNE